MAPMRPRGPIMTFSPITASGPTSAVGSIRAEAATTADGWMPGVTGGSGWNSAATLAQATSGSEATIATAVSGTLSFMSGWTMTAAAWVAASTGRYLRLFRQKVTSCPVAASSGAMPMQHQPARRGLGALPLDAGRIDDGGEGMRPGAPKEAGIARQRRAVPTERRGVGRHG